MNTLAIQKITFPIFPHLVGNDVLRCFQTWPSRHAFEPDFCKAWSSRHTFEPAQGAYKVWSSRNAFKEPGLQVACQILVFKACFQCFFSRY